MPSISVVIPYYQCEPGCLQRAIRSALRQQAVATPEIIVVDDGSPLPSAAELENLDAAERRQVTVLHQPNRGPGPARNAGLDAVNHKTDWVALLDSDDVWDEWHLARGLTALGEGYDFFFADLERDEYPGTYFGLTGFDPSLHRPLSVDSSLFEYVGDFFNGNLAYSPVGTSTVIIRRKVLGSLRFPTMRKIIPHEDLIFFLEAGRATNRVAFDSTVQVRYGRGNLTFSDDWKSAKSLRMTFGFSNYIVETKRRYPLNKTQAVLMDQMQRENRKTVARIVMGMLRQGKLPDPVDFGPYLWRHPGLVSDMVSVLREKAVRLGHQPQ